MSRPDESLLPPSGPFDVDWKTLLDQERVALRRFSSCETEHLLDDADDEPEQERSSWSGVVQSLVSLTVGATGQTLMLTEAGQLLPMPPFLAGLSAGKDMVQLRAQVDDVGAEVGELRGEVGMLRDELETVRRLLEGVVVAGGGSSAVLQAIAASVTSGSEDDAGETITQELAAILYPDADPSSER